MPKIANGAGPEISSRTTHGRLSVVILIALSILCAGGAAAAVLLEVRPLNLVVASNTERWQMLRRDPPPIALSLASDRGLLDTCLSAVTSVYGRMRATDDRRAVAANCGHFAEASAAMMPSNSYAWYSAAHAAALGADSSRFEQYWLQSARTAPNEQWLAALRVVLLEDNPALATPALRDAERQDLALLVTSRRGISAIAKRYVAQRDFRERVVSVVEQMPQADQRRFLDAVTQEAASSGAAR